mmetsp:Transcript_2786/g.9443  ORF Transcript_2786/g.9443 Transcript_2786/m.9443 type:complete len:200 (-) Transcript_2786:1201-1800(-)
MGARRTTDAHPPPPSSDPLAARAGAAPPSPAGGDPAGVPSASADPRRAPCAAPTSLAEPAAAALSASSSSASCSTIFSPTSRARPSHAARAASSSRRRRCWWVHNVHSTLSRLVKLNMKGKIQSRTAYCGDLTSGPMRACASICTIICLPCTPGFCSRHVLIILPSAKNWFSLWQSCVTTACSCSVRGHEAANRPIRWV